jgi:predicted ribosome quality control (RQC) complex YloA/Tae2 family protein
MKIIKEIQEDGTEITYLIGENANDNSGLINRLSQNDIWIHLRNLSSPHVVIKSDGDAISDMKPQYRTRILKQGCFLCHQGSKYKNSQNVAFIWTEGRYVSHGSKPGEAIVSKENIIKL